MSVFATPARQAFLYITNSWSLPKFMFIELVMPSNHLILCHPLLSPSIFPRIRVFSNESFLHIRWPILGRSDLYSLTLTSMTTGKTIALTRWTFVGKVMSLLFNMQSCHSFYSKEQVSFSFIARITICSDFGAQKIKSDTVSMFPHRLTMK